MIDERPTRYFAACDAGHNSGFKAGWTIARDNVERLKKYRGATKFPMDPVHVLEVFEAMENDPESEFAEQIKRGNNNTPPFIASDDEAFEAGFFAGAASGWAAGKQVIEAMAEEKTPYTLEDILQALDVAWEKGARKFFQFNANLVKVVNVLPSSSATQ